MNGEEVTLAKKPVIIKQPFSALHMVPTVTEGMVDGKIIYSVGTGQGQASRFESAVQILLQDYKIFKNPGEVEKRI